MSSILTNNGAMTALQTLKGINKAQADVQNMISTGKAINSAKDNAAVWAISKVMEADVTGFKAISDSLTLGESTVAVAKNASESVTDLLTEIKGKIVQSQESNVDRGKIQQDISALRDQITSVVSSAQFNGLNLVDGSTSTTNANGNTGVDVMASLDRAADGTVTTAKIGVDAINLSQTAGTALTASTTTDAGTAGVIDGGATNNTVVINALTFQDAAGATGGTAAQPADGTGVNTANAADFLAGDTLTMTIGNSKATYTIREGDTADVVMGGLKNAIADSGVNTDDLSLAISGAGELTITNNTNADVDFSFEMTRGAGGLASLATLDVSNAANAANALTDIEGLIQTSIDAAASFGSSQNRIEIQNDFVGKLSDSMKAGIGAMVDADMEETSARLQALQVQQQLGVQSLSMANQAPQSLLSLFR